MASTPGVSEIEVSFFGPGYGESILVHVGDGQWIVVDSCVEPGEKYPAPLRYLDEIGVDPREAVKLVVVSHWHDDHIRGMSQVVEACDNADVVFSHAIKCKEFLDLLVAYKDKAESIDYGAEEYQAIVQMLYARTGAQKKTPVWANADRALWGKSLSDGDQCSVYALSPSDQAITDAHLSFAKLLPVPGAPVLALTPDINQNETSIVLHLEIGDFCVLLGSDLEHHASIHHGWNAIIASKAKLYSKSSLFKIPHHGSSNGHCPQVWSNLLQANPVCVLSPFANGSVRLPTKGDVARILQHTSQAFSTCRHISRKLKRDRTVERTIEQFGYPVTLANPGFGRVTFRIGNSLPTVDLAGDACPLSEVLCRA